ncbi:anti-phage BREX system Lon protease BrxL, partial [Falsiroseomonas ponticola]|uniref:anti-phage BREX system Lon protease BrxL n=1 Tax=Falsiroseomonas ponticola TaxID=2786951 RepID=UPI00299F3001
MSTPIRDELDNKVNRIFAGKVVRKDLVRRVKVGANVPVFVLEFLLGKYCASSDELAIQMGLQVVNQTLGSGPINQLAPTRPGVILNGAEVSPCPSRSCSPLPRCGVS